MKSFGTQTLEDTIETLLDEDEAFMGDDLDGDWHDDAQHQAKSKVKVTKRKRIKLEGGGYYCKCVPLIYKTSCLNNFLKKKRSKCYMHAFVFKWFFLQINLT